MLTLIVLALIGAGPTAAQDLDRMLAGFDIAVARTSKGVSLVCKAGCAWHTLEFARRQRPTPVNEFGMADDKTANKENDGHFLIRIGMKGDQFELSCDRGCAWRTLAWTLRPNGTATRITEYGMADKGDKTPR